MSPNVSFILIAVMTFGFSTSAGAQTKDTTSPSGKKVIVPSQATKQPSTTAPGTPPAGVTIQIIVPPGASGQPAQTQIIDPSAALRLREFLRSTSPGTTSPGTCDAGNADRDRDGHVAIECGGDDCDDSDVGTQPGAIETCDVAGKDEDCNPTTLGGRDADGDGYVDGQCTNRSGVGDPRTGDDCDDLRPGVHPNLAEVCDHRDNDCNGQVDEGVMAIVYTDNDGDGRGIPGSDIEKCPQDMRGYSFYADDCNDDDRTVSPLTAEIRDGKDNNCDGKVDEGL